MGRFDFLKHLTRGAKSEKHVSLSDAVASVKQCLIDTDDALASHAAAEQALSVWQKTVTSNAERISKAKNGNAAVLMLQEKTGIFNAICQETSESVQKSDVALRTAAKVFEDALQRADGLEGCVSTCEDGERIKTYILNRNDALYRARDQQVMPSIFKFASPDLLTSGIKNIVKELYDPSSEAIYMTKDGLVVVGVEAAVSKSICNAVDQVQVRVLPFSTEDVTKSFELHDAVIQIPNSDGILDALGRLSVRKTAEIFKVFSENGRTYKALQKGFLSQGITATLGYIPMLTKEDPSSVLDGESQGGASGAGALQDSHATTPPAGDVKDNTGSTPPAE